MNHATRMLLIPEEFYRSLIDMEKSEEKANSGDGTALGLIRERLQNTGDNPLLDPNTKAARYEQDFKRYNKLNFGEIADTLLNNRENQNNKLDKKPLQQIAVRRTKKISLVKINKKRLPGHVKVEPKNISDKNIEEELDYYSPDSETDIGEQALKYVKENSRALGVTND
uniref:Uncharacterized protein n=1 Tax=Meloidogyne hapla TaxID=6305 RepID=A0A1I8BUU6_MELHA